MNIQDDNVLLAEEQQILDDLIREIDQAVRQIRKNLSYEEDEKIQAAGGGSLSETYRAYLSASHNKDFFANIEQMFLQLHDELYDTRLELQVNDDQSDHLEIKVGLHTFQHLDRIYVESWKTPVCRHFLMDDSNSDFSEVTTDKLNRTHKSKYSLLLKRKVDILFDKVRKVSHLFPLSEEEAEKIIADEFLAELLSRREDKEFRNIVFSIQRKQGQIIQNPYQNNIIVQGCAGSGKSMIMMHRLPILLFDNGNILSRNSIYIITPSRAYVQMAEKMMYELEINDLKIGTLNQYYDYVIEEKYKDDINGYGSTGPQYTLSKEAVDYVYSTEFIKDINEIFIEKVTALPIDIDAARNVLKMDRPKGKHRDHTPFLKIQRLIIELNDIAVKNRENLGIYLTAIGQAADVMKNIHNMLEGRYQAVVRSIRKTISIEEKGHQKISEELWKIDKEAHPKAYENREKLLDASQNRIAELQNTLAEAGTDQAYFEKLSEIDQIITGAFPTLIDPNTAISEYTDLQIYELMTDTLGKLIVVYERLLKEFRENIDEKYLQYTGSVYTELIKGKPVISNLRNISVPVLSQNYYTDIGKALKYYRSLSETLVRDTYQLIGDRVGLRKQKNGDIAAADCSPYMYTQIIYQYRGMPNTGRETLMAIDEAQTVAPVELELIKNINGNKVILNLYGDVAQHIEGEKGIDSWKEFENIASFTYFEMNENYRNTGAITDYCNRAFRMNMRPINFKGKNVHTTADYLEAVKYINQVMLSGENKRINAIIVKDSAAARTVLNSLSGVKGMINHVESQGASLSMTKCNLLCVAQAKGLEFSNVFVFSDRMTEHEKYISFTRAMNELRLCKGAVPLMEEKQIKQAEKLAKDEEETIKPDAPSASKATVKRVDKPVTKVKETAAVGTELTMFFEGKGLEVIDQRSEGGMLWVVGSKAEIEPIILEAVSEFGISGSYSSGKATGYRSGWFTKSKK